MTQSHGRRLVSVLLDHLHSSAVRERLAHAHPPRPKVVARVKLSFDGRALGLGERVLEHGRNRKLYTPSKISTRLINTTEMHGRHLVSEVLHTFADQHALHVSARHTFTPRACEYPSRLESRLALLRVSVFFSESVSDRVEG